MTAPAQKYYQCAVAKFDYGQPTRDKENKVVWPIPRIVVHLTHGTTIPPSVRPIDIKRPTTKEPPKPSTMTLSPDERMLIFSINDIEREMTGDEITQARAWLVWRWPATEANAVGPKP